VKAMRKANGFTLIEMLVVLTVISVLTVVTIPQIKSLSETKELQYFIEQFTDDMLYAQQYAMVHKTSVTVVFYPYEPTYRVVKGNAVGRVLLDRTYSSKLQIQPTTLKSPLIFLANGNVNKSGTILVTHGEHLYKIVFLLGKGRFYVQKI
jgi:competence protein ComGD